VARLFRPQLISGPGTVDPLGLAAPSASPCRAACWRLQLDAARRKRSTTAGSAPEKSCSAARPASPPARRPLPARQLPARWGWARRGVDRRRRRPGSHVLMRPTAARPPSSRRDSTRQPPQVRRPRWCPAFPS